METTESERERERIHVSCLKMTEREVMRESVRGSRAGRSREKNGEMRRGRLMGRGGSGQRAENELVHMPESQWRE